VHPNQSEAPAPQHSDDNSSPTLPYIVPTDQSRAFIDLYACPRLFIDLPSGFNGRSKRKIA
jgi:hypothetical protein